MNNDQHIPKGKLLESIWKTKRTNFLIIVGKNGQGKSRFLNYLIDQAPTIENGYKNIIAISTSIFEIFPAKLTSKNKDGLLPKYHYIGSKSVTNTKSNNRASFNLIVSSCLGILKRYHEDIIENPKYEIRKNNKENLRHIFENIEFEPVIEYIIKVDPLVDFFMDSKDGINFIKKGEAIVHVKEIRRAWGIYELLNRLKRCSDRNNNVRLGYMLDKGIALFNNGNLKNPEIENLIWLIDNEILRIIDVRFRKNKHVSTREEYDKGWYSMRLASSGEQCIIMTVVGIASSIRNESLIFIDEPEISLHPEWQEKFIDFLNTSFGGYSGCMFIIATHSPQLISKLPHSNSYIYNIAEETLTAASNFSYRSSDYQLANIFNAPGANNEYLSRVLITWLVKFSKSEQFSIEEKNEVKSVIKLKNKLHDDDPVKRLMVLVEDTMGSI